MIPTHCRHRKYPEPGGPRPTHCLVGVEYTTLPYGAPRLGAGNPCDARGHAAGRICPQYAPWTLEDIAADDAETERYVAEMLEGRCPECGDTLSRSEGEGYRVSWCPWCVNVVMRECKVGTT